MVRHVTFDGKKATGVVVADPAGDIAYEGREIIVAAGSVHSPGILVRSGIGHADEVKSLGIDPLVELPVGDNLIDHSSIGVTLKLTPEGRVDDPDFRHTNVCLRYSSGLAGAGDNDMMMVSMNLGGFDEDGFSRGSLWLWTLQTFSTGELRQRSADPMVHPNIDIRMLSDERDMVRLRDGYKRLYKMLKHPAFTRIIAGYSCMSRGDFEPELWPDDEIDQFLLENAADTQHPVGTCRMGAPDDPRSVVDSECRVIGVDGLRVIDASIMPLMVRANTNFTVIAMAEHAAKLLTA